MGKTTRRKFTPEFKAKVALETLKESSTKDDLAKKYEISPEMISRWKKELVDEQYNKCAAMGVRQMVDYLKGEGHHVGKKLVRRLMALRGLRAVYPLKSLSKGGWIKYLYDISTSWSADNETQSGMEHRHLLHTYRERIHVSVCHH